MVRSSRPEGQARPFRWNIARREQLGRLLEGPAVETYRGFYDDLRTVSAKVLARCGDSHMVFVGRSAENIFDYLSGLFHGTPVPPPLTLLQFSGSPDVLDGSHRKEVAALLRYFSAERLDPASIVGGGPQVRFIDLVRYGGTFTTVFALMKHWSHAQRADWSIVKKRIGFIGITAQGKNSPNTWRWQQRLPWVGEIDKANVKNVSIPIGQWTWIGNHEEKATPSFSFDRWASSDATLPNRGEQHLKGLRLAATIFDRGRDKNERTKFAKELAAQSEMSLASFRTMILRLKSI